MYPPFLLMGVRIRSMSPDYRHMEVTLALRWWARNLNGTLFGGFMCAATDPLAALMCHGMFPGAEIWTKSHEVEFLKPARTALHVDLNIGEPQFQSIREELRESGQTTQTFEYQMVDARRRVVARVRNVLFIRRAEGRRVGPAGEPLLD